MKAIGYLRELRAAPPALSLEGQQRAFLDACARAGLEVGATFTELAGAPGQPELRRLLRTSAGDGQRVFTVAIVAGLTVLGDSAREQWVRALQFEAAGVPLHLAGGGPLEAALLAAWAARGPEERRRERAIEGMRRRALRGEVLGRPPFGYRAERLGAPPASPRAAGAGLPRAARLRGRPVPETRLPPPRSRLVPHEEEAAVVRRIFFMYLDDGDGVRRIAARLNADGVRTRRGGAWNMASVRDLLRNPVYTGTYQRLGVTIVGAHTALVSRAAFQEVQRRLAARRSSGGARRRREYPLSGIAYCGHCGAHLVGASRRASGGGEHRYYRCGAAAGQGRCRARTRRAEELEAEVLAQLEAGSPWRPLLAPAAPSAAGAEEARAAQLLRALTRMIERRASGAWTAAQLARRAAPLALALLAREDAASSSSGAPGAPAAATADARAEARRRLAGRWGSLDDAERRALLLEVVREVLVSDDGVRVALAG